MALPSEGRFRPGWRMTLFAAVLLPVLVSLGLWQLGRAEEKQAFEAAYLDRLAALPAEAMPGAAPFQRVRLKGVFERDRYFLLDNQTRGGRVGFAVVGVLMDDQGRRWLLNRGFIGGDPARRSLPEIPVPEGPVEVIGVVWPDLGLMPMFDEADGTDHWGDGWPKVIQRLEIERMADALEGGVGLEIRVEDGQAAALSPPVLEMNMPAAKHLAYAAQWFGLAAVLGTGYLYFGFRRGARQGRNETV